MIKIIASDLDGTLLTNEGKKVPSDFEKMLDFLDEKGIAFVVASGRDFDTAKRFFGKYAERVMFVLDNGSNIYNGTELMKSQLMDDETVHKMIDFASENGIENIFMCTNHGYYINDRNQDYIERMSVNYPSAVPEHNLHPFVNEVYKVSFFTNKGDLRENVYEPLVKRFGDKLTIHESAVVWVDTMPKNTDKGAGIQYLQNHFGATKEETIAFGDYYNDIPLFDNAGYVVIMKNGAEDLKEKYMHVTEYDCNNDGVTKYLWKYFRDNPQ